jgi:hypothetical protein
VQPKAEAERNDRTQDHQLEGMGQNWSFSLGLTLHSALALKNDLSTYFQCFAQVMHTHVQFSLGTEKEIVTRSFAPYGFFFFALAIYDGHHSIPYFLILPQIIYYG